MRNLLITFKYYIRYINNNSNEKDKGIDTYNDL